ncbi:flagellar basal-body protein FlbY [Brevundimonas sp.]|uniref:flagellar basal-body protein FlbY n=1 Tax=Brevundimonas sp. TaxID=1871086 RepID=UPI00351923A8
MNDTSLAVTASARVRQLIDLTQALTRRLSDELAAFEAQRPQDVAAGLAQTQDMANRYRRESAQLKADPSGLAHAPVADRTALIKATEAFEAILNRHARAVEAARIISEGLVKTLAAEIRSQRGVPNAYGATGQATPTDGSAVAFSRSA